MVGPLSEHSVTSGCVSENTLYLCQRSLSIAQTLPISERVQVVDHLFRHKNESFVASSVNRNGSSCPPIFTLCRKFTSSVPSVACLYSAGYRWRRIVVARRVETVPRYELHKADIVGAHRWLPSFKGEVNRMDREITCSKWGIGHHTTILSNELCRYISGGILCQTKAPGSVANVFVHWRNITTLAIYVTVGIETGGRVPKETEISRDG